MWCRWEGVKRQSKYSIKIKRCLLDQEYKLEFHRILYILEGLLLLPWIYYLIGKNWRWLYLKKTIVTHFVDDILVIIRIINYLKYEFSVCLQIKIVFDYYLSQLKYVKINLILNGIVSNNLQNIQDKKLLLVADSTSEILHVKK